MLRAFICMLVLNAFLPPTVGRPIPPAGSRSDTVQEGVRISVFVSHRSYPLNALASVRVVLQNISHRGVLAPDPCSREMNPRIQVMRDNGGPAPKLMPPPPNAPNAPCTDMRPRLLKPGAAIHWDQYVVLTARHVGVRMGLATAASLYITHWIVARPLAVRLLPPDTPRVSLSTSAMISAQVQPDFIARGPMMFTDWAICPEDEGQALVRGWAAAVSNRIEPGCLDTVEWHGLAGWPGHSVAVIREVKEPNP